MPPRDDESRFEQVLARHLRRGASCPDAETLAAYYDRALAAEEMNAFKGHIAACGRCQEVLAGLEASEGVTVHEKDELYVADLASAHTAERMLAAPMSAAPEPRAAAAPAIRTRPNRIWKWMAPAAAVAAGLLVWVGVRQMQRTPPETTTVAVNAPPRAADDASKPTPALKEQVTAQSQDQRTAEKQPQTVAPAAPPPAIPSGTRKEADELTAQLNAGKEQKLDQKAPRKDANATTGQYANSGRAENQVSALNKQQAAGGENASQENQKTRALPPPDEQFGMEGSKKEAGQPVAAESAPANAPEYRAGQMSAPGKAKRAAQEEPRDEKQRQQHAPGDKDSVAVTAGAASTHAFGKAKARENEQTRSLAKPEAEPKPALALRDSGALFTSAAGLVVTTKKSVMWRVGPAGMILKTTDGGLSWIRQASGVSAELIAGSAPSETVCWVVGHGGTILRTTDGEHWERLASPAKSGLIGIDARDAQTAVVQTSDRLTKYVTRDGGKTWQRLLE